MEEWVNDLKDKGYKYVFMPKRKRKYFWAIKDELVNGQPKDETDVDIYELYNGETYSFPKNEWIKL